MSYFNNETVLFKDGTFEKAAEARLSLYQQTTHYGNGAFEGIRSYETPDGTRIFKAKEHFDRLLFSAKAMHLNLTYTAAEMEAFTYELLRRNNLTDAYIRPLVYAGESMSLTPSDECHLVIMAWKWDRYLGDEPLRVTLSPFHRPNPKSTVVEAKLTGRFNLPIAMSEPGMFLSHPTTATMASYQCAPMTDSMESAMISRETSEKRIPSVPLEIPSLTPIVWKIKPTSSF